MNAIIATSASIAATARLNVSNRPLFEGTPPAQECTTIGERVFVGDYTVVGLACRLGEDTRVQPHCIIESDVQIGNRCILMNRALLQSGVRVGDDCVVAGLIGENTIIGKRCRVFGIIGHSHTDPSRPWDADDSTEPAPVIGDDTFVGLNAILTGQITIGPKAYVCAGAIVSRSVPPLHICAGINRIVRFEDWTGHLRHSPFFQS